MSTVRSVDYSGEPVWKRASQRKLRELAWQPCAWQDQLRRGEPLSGITVVDGHAHLGEYHNFFMNKPDAANMVAVMDRIGMQAAVVSANAAISSDVEFGNRMVLEAVRAFPGRFLGYAVANPHETETMEASLNRCLDEPGMVAIKLHPELHDDYPMRGPRYEPAWEVARQRGVPVLFHTYFGGDTLDDIAYLAEKYPSVPLLVGHELQDKSLDAMAELANAFPNVYVDFTVPEIYGVTEFFYLALDDLGKLIFGTDFPWGNCHFRVGAVIYARIPEEAKRQVLGENLARLLGISLEGLRLQSQIEPITNKGA